MSGRVKRATLADVAQQAGVSATTASYILNGRSEQMRISEATQAKVRDIASALGYRPNRTAQNLRTSTTRTIGFVSDRVASGQFSNAMLVGASAAARRRDHLLVISDTNGSREVEQRTVEEMEAWGVDGIVYATLAASTVHVPEALRRMNVVLLNCRSDDDRPWKAVVPDDHQAGRDAVDELAPQPGDVVLVVGDDAIPASTAGVERKSGIAERLAELGCTDNRELQCPWAVREVGEVMADWLAAGHRADKIICMNDRVAMGVYRALVRYGLAVGDDVSIISFDGSDLAEWLDPPVTSMKLPLARMGALAVDALLDGLTGPQVVRVPLEVLPGRSVVSGRS